MNDVTCNTCKWNKCVKRKENISCHAYERKLVKAKNVVNRNSKAQRHAEICKHLKDVYISKNHDYDDSFAKVRNRIGDVAILVRVLDKTERLVTLLMGADARVKEEKVEDTLEDLANYCLMELIEREIDRDGKVKK